MQPSLSTHFILRFPASLQTADRDRRLLMACSVEEYKISLDCYDSPPDEYCLILRREDVFRFCGGISGLDLDCYVPQMLSDIKHHLYLCSPEVSRLRVPTNVPPKVPTHRRLLEEYQRALAGCCHIWIIWRKTKTAA